MQQQAALRAVTGKAGTYTALHAAQSGRCRSCRCKKRSGLQECLLQPLQLHVLLGAVLVGLLVLLRWPKALVPWGPAGPERNQLLHSWYAPSTLHSPVGAADPLLGPSAVAEGKRWLLLTTTAVPAENSSRRRSARKGASICTQSKLRPKRPLCGMLPCCRVRGCFKHQ